MVRNHLATGRAMPMFLGIALGLIVAMGTMIVAAAVIAWLTLSGKMPLTALGYVIMVVHGIAVSLGGCAACGTIKRRKMMVCWIIGGGYLMCLIGCTALFFGGQYQGVPVAAIVILATSALAGWIATRGDNAKIKGYKKYGNR